MNEEMLMQLLGGSRPQMSGNINQLYGQMMQSQMQGPAQNFANTVNQGFGMANMMNSSNMQAIRDAQARVMSAQAAAEAQRAAAQAAAQAQVEAERIRQEGQTGRVRDLSPLLQSLLGGAGLGGGMTTNYGAGGNVAQGSPARPVDASRFRGMAVAAR